MKTANENKHGHHGELVEIIINNSMRQTHRGINSVPHLKHLGGIPPQHELVEVKGGQHHRLGGHAEVEICGYEVFVGDGKEHREKFVDVKINNVERKTHEGENSIIHLKNIGHVPADEILSQFKDGRFVDLADDARVEIHGCEVFASHKPSGGSS